MSTNTDYITTEQFRAAIKDPSALDNDPIEMAISSASREVDAYCGRHFFNEDLVQYLEPDSFWICGFDDMDLATTSGLIVATSWGNNGVYETLWTLDTDFILEPTGGSVHGVDGWPFTFMRSRGGKQFPPRIAPWYQAPVKVTGTWGWANVPVPVQQATLMLATANFKNPEAPFGVAGFGTFGAVRVRDDPRVANKLQVYKKSNTLLMA